MSLASVVRETEVVLSLPDPRRSLRRVRLVHELFRPRVGPDFVREGRTWTLRLPRPPVDRFEYQLELTRASGRVELVCDPENPLRAPGPFGDKSVVELPEYEPPDWLESEAPEGELVPLEIPCRALRASLRALVWSPAGVPAGRPLPLLVAHDGSDYADYSALLRFLEVAIAERELPPLRAALLDPVDRDQNYSASAAYGRAVANDVLPALQGVAPTRRQRRWRVGMGASLGALSMLNLHHTQPELFGGLYLQSGSFFRERWDKHESGFVRFARITRYVGKALAGRDADPIPVTITCGTIEENLTNNRAVRDALASRGYDVRMHESRDGHNWVAWRDTFAPHLVELLRRTWG